MLEICLHDIPVKLCDFIKQKKTLSQIFEARYSVIAHEKEKFLKILLCKNARYQKFMLSFVIESTLSIP